MHVVPASGNRIKRITILNTKGGCGKSILATNIASMLASRGLSTTLIDYDPLGSAINWLKKRPADLPDIHGIHAASYNAGVTRSWQMRTPPGTDRLVIDTPAGVRGLELNDFITNTDYALIPVIPSDSDINATAQLVSELLLNVRIRKLAVKVGVVTNRVKKNTKILERLNRFLAHVDFPVLTTLRDTQNYVNAETQGKGIHELYPPSLVKKDVSNMEALLNQIESGTVMSLAAPVAGFSIEKTS